MLTITTICIFVSFAFASATTCNLCPPASVVSVVNQCESVRVSGCCPNSFLGSCSNRTISSFLIQPNNVGSVGLTVCSGTTSCCASCSCTEDPHCISFAGTHEDWVVCDTRNDQCSFANDALNCSAIKYQGESCIIRPDLNGNNFCQYNPAVSQAPIMKMYSKTYVSAQDDQVYQFAVFLHLSVLGFIQQVDIYDRAPLGILNGTPTLIFFVESAGRRRSRCIFPPEFKLVAENGSAFVSNLDSRVQMVVSCQNFASIQSYLGVTNLQDPDFVGAAGNNSGFCATSNITEIGTSNTLSPCLGATNTLIRGFFNDYLHFGIQGKSCNPRSSNFFSDCKRTWCNRRIMFPLVSSEKSLRNFQVLGFPSVVDCLDYVQPEDNFIKSICSVSPQNRVRNPVDCPSNMPCLQCIQAITDFPNRASDYLSYRPGGITPAPTVSCDVIDVVNLGLQQRQLNSSIGGLAIQRRNLAGTWVSLFALSDSQISQYATSCGCFSFALDPLVFPVGTYRVEQYFPSIAPNKCVGTNSFNITLHCNGGTVGPSIPRVPGPTASPGGTLAPESISPSMSPSLHVPTSLSPALEPTSFPLLAPSQGPALFPSSSAPTTSPLTFSPIAIPSSVPSFSPEAFNPTFSPMSIPSTSPVSSPSISPTFLTTSPSKSPFTEFPTSLPSRSPLTKSPTAFPSKSPRSRSPSKTSPTLRPSASPATNSPLISPTASPSKSPVTNSPTTVSPQTFPSSLPSHSPITNSPSTATPTSFPSKSPRSRSPSKVSPTFRPSVSPATNSPLISPTASPSKSPVTNSPSSLPSHSPITNSPSVAPATTSPLTSLPSLFPSRSPVIISSFPTSSPSESPLTSSPQTSFPTRSPTRLPTTSSPQTSFPTPLPSESPVTNSPQTTFPTSSPTKSPATNSPQTSFPTPLPSESPVTNSPQTTFPTSSPTKSPATNSPQTSFPTPLPSESPVTNSPQTTFPTSSPTKSPATNSPQTSFPTPLPSESPVTNSPQTTFPTSSPTKSPATNSPQASFPTPLPSESPVTNSPQTTFPTSSPTKSPTTNSPRTSSPTKSPTTSPQEASPTSSPAETPVTNSPRTSFPTHLPTHSPVTRTAIPSTFPVTISPSNFPAAKFPTKSPSKSPITKSPFNFPTTPPVSTSPTISPSKSPVRSPVKAPPTSSPSSSPKSNSPVAFLPTKSPIIVVPTKSPSTITSEPSFSPISGTTSPSFTPTTLPISFSPSNEPSLSPRLRTTFPSFSPVALAPTTQVPSLSPTVPPSECYPAGWANASFNSICLTNYGFKGSWGFLNGPFGPPPLQIPFHNVIGGCDKSESNAQGIVYFHQNFTVQFHYTVSIFAVFQLSLYVGNEPFYLKNGKPVVAPLELPFQQHSPPMSGFIVNSQTNSTFFPINGTSFYYYLHFQICTCV